MHFLVLFAFGVAVAQASSDPPLAEQRKSLNIKDDRSLLSSLLKVSGYSGTCVAAALDICSTRQDDSCYASFMEEAREVLQQVSAAVSTWESRPRHCKDLLLAGDSGSGLRQVYPYPGQPHHRVSVFCEQTVDGGGWTVFQRRTSDAERQDFFRTWLEYQLGFGDVQGEHWLGLDVLHQLTSTSLQQLRIDMGDYEGEHRHAKYSFFHVAGPDTNYRLNVRNYSGDAGNSLKAHNGQQFSTHDADHDKESGNCADGYQGAWWYNNCHDSNLNGYQYVGNDSPRGKGITWHHWKGPEYSLKSVAMMSRPAF